MKARAESLGIDPARFEKTDIHMHIPAGAIPKDGPSAGVAMFVALASLALDKPVRHDLAMTGEISLRGLVLPVGGIKEKVLAALQAGIRTVMLPARNRRDLEDIPEDAPQAPAVRVARAGGRRVAHGDRHGAGGAGAATGLIASAGGAAPGAVGGARVLDCLRTAPSQRYGAPRA